MGDRPRVGISLRYLIHDPPLSFTPFLKPTCFTNHVTHTSDYFHFFLPDCLHGLLSWPFLLRHSVFVFNFSLPVFFPFLCRADHLVGFWAHVIDVRKIYGIVIRTVSYLTLRKLKVVFGRPYSKYLFVFVSQLSAAVSASPDGYQLNIEKMVDVPWV